MLALLILRSVGVVFRFKFFLSFILLLTFVCGRDFTQIYEFSSYTIVKNLDFKHCFFFHLFIHFLLLFSFLVIVVFKLYQFACNSHNIIRRVINSCIAKFICINQYQQTFRTVFFSINFYNFFLIVSTVVLVEIFQIIF